MNTNNKQLERDAKRNKMKQDRKAIVSGYYAGKFNKEEHMNAGCPKIQNDKNLFILRDSYGTNNIWQIGGRLTDMTGFIISHLYKVRRIGVLFD